MDSVPIAFFKHVCDTLYTRGLSEVEKLPGTLGEVAQFAYDHRTCYMSVVLNGHEVSGCLCYCRNLRKVRDSDEIKRFPRKFVRHLTIMIADAKEETACRQLVNRFPYAISDYYICSESISEAWVHFVSSVKILGIVKFTRKLDSHGLALFKKLVDGQKLSRLALFDYCCESGVELLKSLLCQEQFVELGLSNYHNSQWK
uniref:Protein UL24 homolog n=1 Tax=Steinernema glaseri TaxID=37863 RepID=A0A1I8ACC0_9BILA